MYAAKRHKSEPAVLESILQLGLHTAVYVGDRVTTLSSLSTRSSRLVPTDANGNE